MEDVSKSTESNREDTATHELSNDDEDDDDYEKDVDVIELHGKIAKSQYQNEVNIQRLHELECEDEKKSRTLLEKDALMMKYKKENEELKKELIVKKKFVFNM